MGTCREREARALLVLPRRSLMAAYELFENDFRNVRVLKDGMNGWAKQERAVVEGSE